MTLYSPEIVEAICERLSYGESLVSICKSEGMPKISTVFSWLADPEKKDFVDKYARAREAQADYLAEETMDISDDGKNDWMLRNDPNNPGWVANGEHIQRSRLRVDARKWYAGKVAPKKYGDTTTVEHKGAVACNVSGLPATLVFLGKLNGGGSVTDLEDAVPDRPLLSAPVRSEP